MTKASMIRGLIRQRFSNVQIAEMIGCTDAYVRAVRQRYAGVNHDKSYRLRLREKAIAIPGARELARNHARDVYRKNRDAGVSVDLAHKRRGAAYQRALIKVAREAA